MAPEQADGRPVTFQCDLYSLGGVLFAMLADGRRFAAARFPSCSSITAFPIRHGCRDLPPTCRMNSTR